MKGLSGMMSAGLALAVAAVGCSGKPASSPFGVRLPEPPDGQPVAAAISVQPETAAPGSEVLVSVGIRIAAGYHIQGAGPTQGPFQPTGVDLVLPDGFVPVGGWQMPAPTVTRSGERIYTDAVVFLRRCRVPLDVRPEGVSIAASLHFQACNDDVCRPPATLTLATPIRVVKKPTR